MTAESAGVELSCLFNALLIGFISTGPWSACEHSHGEGKWRGTHRGYYRGYHTPDQNAQSKPLKALVPASQRFLQLSCSAKPFGDLNCARPIKTDKGFVNYMTCQRVYPCCAIVCMHTAAPDESPLFGQSVSYVADSRPPPAPRAHHTFPSQLRRTTAKGRNDRVRAARGTTTAAQCGPGRDESEYSVGSRVAGYAYRQILRLTLRATGSQDETRVRITVRLYRVRQHDETRLQCAAPHDKRPGLCA
mgnify:CR=1 FL=1